MEDDRALESPISDRVRPVVFCLSSFPILCFFCFFKLSECVLQFWDVLECTFCMLQEMSGMDVN